MMPESLFNKILESLRHDLEDGKIDIKSFNNAADRLIRQYPHKEKYRSQIIEKEIINKHERRGRNKNI